MTPSGVIVKYSLLISCDCATIRSYGLNFLLRVGAGTRNMQRRPCLLWPAVPKNSTQSSPVLRPKRLSMEEWEWEGEAEGEGRVMAREKEGEAGLTGDSMRGKRLGGGDMWVERSSTPILGGCQGPPADFVPLDRTGMRGTSASISFRGSRWTTWGRLAVGR